MKNIYVAKFAIVALTMGVFSPSVSLKQVNNLKMNSYEVKVSLFNTAEARQKNRNSNRNRNSNKNRNSNRNVNRNSNKNVNVNVNSGGGRYYGGGSYNRNGAALVTGMIVGAAITSSN